MKENDGSRAEYIRATKEQSWPRRVNCEACGGDGTVPSDDPDDRLVHRFGGGFGSDSSLASVLEEIRNAEKVWWETEATDVGSLVAVANGHNLFVTTQAGATYAYQVGPPDPSELSVGESEQ